MSSKREKDAIELLRRIYTWKAKEPLYDLDMTVDWVETEIAAFIRKYGSFEEQQKT